jgi:hypothetical protein
MRLRKLRTRLSPIWECNLPQRRIEMRVIENTAASLVALAAQILVVGTVLI